MANETEMRPADFAFLQTLPGNDACVDCEKNKPDWGSPKLGILFCFECSGRHRYVYRILSIDMSMWLPHGSHKTLLISTLFRGLGTHLSFVRSVTMDRWTDKHIKLMKVGGNKQLNDFLSEHQVKTEETTAKEKYDNPAAELYRQKLDARVEGRLEPTELPKENVRQEKPLKKMEGFGSSPSPPPQQDSHTGRNVAIGAVVAVVGLGAWLVSQH